MLWIVVTRAGTPPTMSSQANVAIALFILSMWLAANGVLATIGAGWLWSRRRPVSSARRRWESLPTRQRRPQRSRAPWTTSANPSHRPSAPTPRASATRPPPQPTERPRRSRAPWASSANPTAGPSVAASPPAPDPVPQAVESPTTVVTLAAALGAAPRSDTDRRRLAREFREAARVAAVPSEPDPLSTPEPKPEAGPLPSSAPAEVLRQTADLPPAVERPPRPSSSGRVRRHLTWLIQRQDGRCGICGQPLPQPPTGDVVHVDHIVPLVRGGTDQRTNLQATHAACNLTKGSQGARRPPPGYSSPSLPAL